MTDSKKPPPSVLEAWAIIDIQEAKEPFPYTRWTYAGDSGKKKGLLSIYDKKPTIPKAWRCKKQIIKVTISPTNHD